MSSSLPLLALLPSGLALAWLVSKAQWFWSHRPDLQFGWVVLLLCGYLIWEAWEKRPTVCFRWRFGTLVGVLCAVSLLFLVQIYQAAFGMNPATLLGLAFGTMLFVAANLHYVFGWPGIRHFAFALSFFLISLPMPSVLHNLIVGGLQSKVAAINVEVLNLVGVPARRVGSLIQLPTCTLGVDEACSGIRSLQSTVMATLFIGYLTLKGTGSKLLLLLGGILLAIVGNVARSLFLSFTANNKGLQAIESFHDAAGWSILIFTCVGVIGLAWLFGRMERAATDRSAAGPVVPQAIE